MPWLSNPQRDSRDDIRAAQQALVYAGYPHSRAVAEYETYLYRVRAALAAPRDIVWAGFVVGAVMAVVGLVALLLFVGFGGIVSMLVETPLEPARPVTPAPAVSDQGSLLDLLPTILVTTWALGIAGAGIALVTRNRWRRAGALDTFIDLAPRRVYLFETAAVWLVVAAFIVAVVWMQAGPQMAGATVGPLAFFGIPLLSLAFGAGFPGLYKRLLPRFSPLDAAAYARPIIEREAALQVKSEREFYGRPAYERNRWAEDMLKRLDSSDAARRRQLADRLARQTESYLHGAPLGERLRRYGLLTGGGTLVGWFFTRWLIYATEAGVWRWNMAGRGEAPDLTPLSAGLGADVAGLSVGLILGIGLTWIYTRYLE
ncbi:MAG: hypothetical protein OXR64_03700 [Chloroflexota bacterium]|nr:hypothetical protein [Chloroflexota bacterium]MDE2918929.1 hypothetical protein [Chloroflexota bacterium]